MTGTVGTGVSSVNDDSTFVANNLILKKYVSGALEAVIKLGVPDILATAEGRKPLSAEEILRQLPTKSTPGLTSVRNLQRLLAPLVREGLFTESLDGDEQPVYGLTEVSKWFVRESPLSIASFADMHFHPTAESSERCMHEAILDETTTPFKKAHGDITCFEKPGFGLLLQTAMKDVSKMFFAGAVESLLQSVVLDGVNTLVDVGGGQGHIVEQVVVNIPHIQGINFDLPYVIAHAPAINGVQHVGGNFFESVPSGDAMFLKWVVHNYGDEDAIQILKNCWKSLPAKNGKVIIAEFLMDKHDKGAQATFVEYLDLIMLVYLKGAMERTKEEYQALLVAAGFPRCNFIHIPGCGMTLIEGFKE